MATEFNTREWAARQDKAARYSAYFWMRGIHSSQIVQLDHKDSFWQVAASTITAESGRKLLPPHSQETIDAIVRELGYYEDAKSAQERAADVPFDFARR